MKIYQLTKDFRNANKEKLIDKTYSVNEKIQLRILVT